MLNLNKNNYQRGDTLIEVLIAITVFSAVAVGSLSIMNQGSSISQRALEITLVRQEIDAQAETLRFLNASYLAAYQSVASAGSLTGPALEWKKINDQSVKTASAFGSNLNTCPNVTNITSNRFSDNSVVKSGFILNTKTASVVSMPPNLFNTASTFSQVKYNGNSVTSADGIWIEAVHSAASADLNQSNAGFLDLNIRACWSSPGQAAPVTIGTIVRLYEPIGDYISPLAFHPILPPAPPAAPVVSVAGGANSTWSWLAVTCASGVTPNYRYRYTIDSGYDSGWVATNNLSFSATTNWEGYQYTLAVQSRCYEDATSPWSASGSASYVYPVKKPAAIAFGIYRQSLPGNPYLIYVTATSSCTGGTLLFSRGDFGLTPNWTWSVSGLSGWYGNSNGGIWMANNFAYYGNTLTLGMSSSGYVPTWQRHMMRAYMKCHNWTTGRESAAPDIYGENLFLYAA